MKAVVFNQGITIKDVIEKPITKDSVQIKPKKVLLNGIENAIYLGLLWVEPSRILGSIGIGRVEAVGIGVDKNLEGKDVLVLGYSRSYGGIGTEIDGILAEKAVIPADSVLVLPKEYADKYLLYPYISIGYSLREKLRGKKVLIIGKGIGGILISMTIRDVVSKANILTEGLVQTDFKIYEVEEQTELKGSWDAVILMTFRSWYKLYIDKILEPNGTVYIPRFLKSWPVILPQFPSINIEYVEPSLSISAFEFIEKNITDKIFQELVSYSDDVLSAVPIMRPATIINVEKALA